MRNDNAPTAADRLTTLCRVLILSQISPSLTGAVRHFSARILVAAWSMRCL
jgi:hypothetical protein